MNNPNYFTIFVPNFSNMETRVLPVGIQSFETMRKGTCEYLYIDKTALVYKTVHTFSIVLVDLAKACW